MTTLVLGGVGAAIGGYFGGPVGAQIGFALGSYLGGVLDPEDPVEVRGPRLGDLSISGSTYGGPIPIGYGTLRMGSNMIFARPLREVENRHEEGGKGSAPTAVQISYSYFGTWAVAFAAGPADDVLRIWFDNELVYDQGVPDTLLSDPGPSSGGLFGQTGLFIQRIKASGLTFRFYPGSETQEPDPAMEAEAGVGNVPAHRGLVYIVFDDIDVTKYGNRIPIVSAEIAFSSVDGTTDRFANQITPGEGGLFNALDADGLTVDNKRRRIYTYGVNSPPSTVGLRVHDLDSLAEIRQVTESYVENGGLGFSLTRELHVGSDSGFIYLNVGSANSRPIIKVDPNSLKEVDRFGTSGGGFPSSPTSFSGLKRATEITAIAPLGGAGGDVTVTRRHFLLTADTFNFLGVLDADSMTFLWVNITSPGTIRGLASGLIEIGDAIGWMLVRTTGASTDFNIYKITITAGANTSGGDNSGGVNVSLVDTISSSTWLNDGSSSAGVGPIIDQTDGGLIFIKDAASFTGSYVFKWREGEGVIWVAQTGVGEPSQQHSLTSSSVVSEGIFGYSDGFQDCALIDTVDGAVIVSNFDWTSLPSTLSNMVGSPVFIGSTQSIISGVSGASSLLGQIFLNRAAGLATTDGAIVNDISDRVGFDTATDIDVTELTRSVRGYGITRQMPARAAIEPLGTAYLWDGVESDDKIVFKNRGRAATRTIQGDDLIPVDQQTHSVVVEDRTQEVELPMRISVSYMDIESNYQAGSRGVKRILNPTPTMQSRNDVTIPFPIVMTAQDAVQIAEALLFTTWNERIKYSIKAPWEHLDLDPADVLTLIIDGSGTSTTIRARIARNRVGTDFTIEFDAFKEDQVTIVSDSKSDGALGVPEEIIPGDAFTQLYLLDIPLLRDVDDTGRSVSRLYEGMNGFVANWPGGILWDSVDGGIFLDTKVRNLSGMKYGVITNSLPDTTTPFITDETTQLTVFMSAGGTLSSVTQTQFLNNESVALIGNPATQFWEIVAFRDAVLVSDNIYTVSGLMRGRRGTDVNVGSHVANESFFVLDRDTISALVLNLTLLNSLRYYKGVGTGTLVENADIEALASTMADLKPYAPVELDAVPDGSNNVDLSWTRRTRVGGALRDFTGALPLSEDTEEWEVEILDAPGGSVVRTVLALSTTAYEYTKANLITDIAVGTGTTTLDVASIDEFSRASGSFVTDGFAVGQTIETTGFTDGANNGVFTVTNVAATLLEVSVSTLVVESGGGDENIDVIREDDLTFKVYQISTQVGRGFGREVTITF